MKRKLSFLLAIVLVVSLFPWASAAQGKPANLNIISQTASTLAPGITQDIVYAKTTSGEQIEYYVATADTTRKDVTLNTTYKNAQWNSWGLQTIPEQMAAAENAHSVQGSDRYIANYTAIAGVNGAYYNMTTGQPEGAFAMEGHIIQDAGGKPFFAILKDGTPVIGFNNTDWNNLKANTANPIWEAVAGHTVQVKNSQNVAGTGATRYPRISVGITADKKVVLIAADGWNDPISVGATMSEMAEILLANGCVDGLELDGGGSATYVARQEGDNKLSVVNTPSDGSPRNTSNGLMIVSTTPPSDVFARAVLTAEHSYVTPDSSVKIDTIGVSPAGTPADIPAEAFLQLSDTSLGSIVNGVFISNGTAGDAVIQMTCNDQVVGETTVHVVIPDKLEFRQDSMTVPFGKTIPLNVTAYYGLNEVMLKDGDLAFTLSDPTIGTISRSNFTAGDGGGSSSVTAMLSFADDVAVSGTITLGQGSEVLFDFEDGEDGGFRLSDSGYNYYLPNSAVSVATKANGQVHSGQYALALNVDYSNSFEYGYQRISLYRSGETIFRKGATKLGMWIYVPDEHVSLEVRWQYVSVTEIKEDGSCTVDEGKNFGDNADGLDSSTPGWVGEFDESGWHYLSIDLTGYKGAVLRSDKYIMQFYICDRDGGKYGYYAKNQSNINGNFTIYIDDITVDYSAAVDDREAPIFSELNFAAAGAADAVAITKGNVPTASTNLLDFAARVQEDTKRTNATGLNPASAKAYVDGNEVPCAYANGVIRMDSSQALPNGIHTVKFSICDNQGNYASIIRQIKVQGGSGGVSVVAHDPAADRVPLGSVQYIDIVAPPGKEVQSVTTKLNLDAMNSWELEHMDVAAGYTAAWSMTGSDAADRVATVTITRDTSKDAADSGENGLVLVSIPVRVWNLDNPVKGTLTGKTNTLYTLKQFFSQNECWPVAIDVRVQQGKAIYADGTSDTFTGAGAFIWSECWALAPNMKETAEGQAWWSNLAANGAHVHTNGGAVGKDASCLETGYNDRVFCTVCESPVVWGTAVPATGHTWSVNDEGKLACTGCDKLYTGEYNGTMYSDGVPLAAGWVGDSYYLDGVKLTDIQIVDGKYYNFGEDGICTDKINGYTGFFDRGASKYYVEFGELKTGWFSVLENRYHAGADGVLHTVDTWDDREGSCTRNGYIHYDCSCGESQLSEGMWSEGHKWDANHVCTVCSKQGLNIANATLEFSKGSFFSYTGAAIRPALKTIYAGKELNVRSDRLGEDGYLTYTANVSVGVATITIEGRGDYYGEVTTTFTIVPANVGALTSMQTKENSLTVSWDKAPGSEYYDLWWRSGNEAWVQLNGHVTTTSYTIDDVAPGSYSFAITSLAKRGEEEYRCTNWTYLNGVSVFDSGQIRISDVKNGTVSTSPSGQALPGETVTITATPDSGYQVKSVTVRGGNNAAVPVTKVTDTQYTFTMPASAVTISASFNASGQCRYLPGAGPFTAQLELTGLLAGRTYVCQMQKANAEGKAIGCAAIVVFTAASDTHLLDVLPNPNGYIVSLWAYPSSGSITGISELSIAFFGLHIKADLEQFTMLQKINFAFSGVVAALNDVFDGIEDGLESAEPGISDSSTETDSGDGQDGEKDVEHEGDNPIENGADVEAGGTDIGGSGDPDGGDTEGGESSVGDTHPQSECRYLADSGPFTAQLELSNLLSGRTYVCQMQKADANGSDIGCAAIVVFTATDTVQLLDVLPNPNGYITSLWVYPPSGGISDINDLDNVFFRSYVK